MTIPAEPRSTSLTRFLVAGLAAACLGATSAAAQQPTVVILVRHAERAAEPRADPGLTPEGEARAAALVAALAGARVEGIVTTQFQRTRLTAAPLAQRLGIEAEVVRAGGATAAQHAAAVADHVRQRYSGRTVLVVGHSNTVPAIIGALGGPRMADLCETEYAHLYVLVIRADSTTSLVDAQLGAPDPPGADACRRAAPPPG